MQRAVSPKAAKEEGGKGQLTPYLNQRGQARTVPPRGAEGSPQDLLQAKPDPEARLRRAQTLGHRIAGPAGAPSVQRLVGFEIESSNLPSTPAAEEAVARVRNFLTASAEGKIGDPEPTWSRVSDHSRDLMRTIDSIRDRWAHLLGGENQEELRTGFPYTAMVEYVTSPFDERSQADYRAGGLWGFGTNLVRGTDTMDETLGEIGQEIEDAKENLTVRGTAQLGVPPVADWEEAAVHYRLRFKEDDYEEGTARKIGGLSRKTIMDQVRKDEQNVQATVGILPEKVNAFLAGAADQGSVTGTPISAQDPRLAGVAQLKFLGDTMSRVDSEVDDLVDSLTAQGGELPTIDEDQRAALGGFLRLLLHVTTGDVARYGPGNVKGHDKNMQSFLPKTPLHEIEKQLPKAVRPSNLRTWLFPWTFNSVVGKVYATHLAVAGYMQTLPGGDTLTQAQIDGTDEYSRLGAGSVRAYLRTVLTGSSDPNTAHLAAGRLSPEKPSKGGREGIATGNWLSNKRTRAVALETRHAPVKLPVGGLVQFAQQIAALVRAAHDTD